MKGSTWARLVLAIALMRTGMDQKLHSPLSIGLVDGPTVEFNAAPVFWIFWIVLGVWMWRIAGDLRWRDDAT